jgi:mRNA interferase MazF
MAQVLRGEIRWADLNPVRGHEQAGDRPMLVLSHDVFNERSGTVIAVALTSQGPRAGYPLTLELAAARLLKRSWVKISQIRRRTGAVSHRGRVNHSALEVTGVVHRTDHWREGRARDRLISRECVRMLNGLERRLEG